MKIRKGIFHSIEEVEKIWHVAAMCLNRKDFVKYLEDRGIMANSISRKLLRENVERIISESLIEESTGLLRLHQKDAAEKILKLFDEHKEK
jgi:Mg/Co/Ni transporter MgtE